MKKGKFDFGGWATKNDLLCADGRTIRKDAFKDDDGRTVPLVYQHNHDDPTRVIGHALLENREEGVYAYCSLNGTDIGKHVKECVRHGDINGLSIFANKLTQRGGDVIHGVIRELSVVLAGANPGAVIEFPILEHGEESDTEAYIWPDDEGLDMGEGMSLKHEEEEETEQELVKETESEAEPEKAEEAPEAEPEKPEEPVEETESEPEKVEENAEEETAETETEEVISHADDDETVQDVLDSLNDKQKMAVDYVLDRALGGDNFDESEGKKGQNGSSSDEESVADVLKTLNEKQQKVLAFLLEKAQELTEGVEAEDNTTEEEANAASHSDEEGEEFTMKENVFDKSTVEEKNANTLTHAEMETLLKDAKRLGSLRQSVLEHSDEYGIEHIDYLMPEYREVNGAAPEYIRGDVTWVNKVMSGVHHTPFSRIKTTFADLTEEEARARGYIKGKKKKEEVFSLLKRTTPPTTVYKKQKLDRDDIVDITDFDVVAWLKTEMRLMLNEELARAFMIGDGRASDSDDHIDENCIRPIFKEDDLFVIRKQLVLEEDQAFADGLIDAVTMAWEEYQGSGNCTAYMTRRTLGQIKLLKDRMGRRIYDTESAIASALGVKEIVCIPCMSDTTTVREVGEEGEEQYYQPLVIIVNLNDYNVGADKGGSINMFDDFDIDYNQQKYLIETRCSAALVKPYSAIVIEQEVVEEEEGNDQGET